MNEDYRRTLYRLALVFLLCGSIAAGGCEGTDTREQVDDTVEEMTGKKNLERYQQMKDDIGDINKQQAERHHQLDKADE